MKLISVIVPAYNESDCGDRARRLGAVFDSLSAADFEAIIIENGFSDDTYEKLLAIRDRDPRCKIVQLARNFRNHVVRATRGFEALRPSEHDLSHHP